MFYDKQSIQNGESYLCSFVDFISIARQTTMLFARWKDQIYLMNRDAKHCLVCLKNSNLKRKRKCPSTVFHVFNEHMMSKDMFREDNYLLSPILGKWCQQYFLLFFIFTLILVQIHTHIPSFPVSCLSRCLINKSLNCKQLVFKWISVWNLHFLLILQVILLRWVKSFAIF